MVSISCAQVNDPNPSLELFGNVNNEKESFVVEEIVKNILPSFLYGWEICSLACASRSWKQLLKNEFAEAFRIFEDHPFLEKQIPKNFNNEHLFEVVESLFFETFMKSKPLAQSLNCANALQSASLKEFPQVILDLNLSKFVKLPSANESLSDFAKKLRAFLREEEASEVEIIHCKEFNLTVLPSEIGFLTGLKCAVLSENHLSHLPDSIGNLKQLTLLSLYENALISLPDSIGELRQLEYLFLRNNQLSTLPDAVRNLTQLTDLDLSNNQLNTFPDQIPELNLSRLFLSHNELQILPDRIENLKALTHLILSNNQLKSLPESIGNLGALTNLNLSDNQLQALPDSIGNLSALTKLNLSDNQLQALPDSIGNLGALTHLTLSHNQLRFLPDSIRRLKNLKVLSLWGMDQIQISPSVRKHLKAMKTKITSDHPECTLL